MAHYVELSINARDTQSIELPEDWDKMSRRQQNKILDEQRSSFIELVVEVHSHVYEK